MKNRNIWTILSAILFFVGLFLSLTINGYIKDFDKHHLLILAPITGPIIGLVLGIFGVAKANRYMKILPIVSVLANLGLAGLIFITYSFSYWQF